MNAARKRRLYYILLILAGVAIATAIALAAFRQNLMFFYSPSEVAAGEAPLNRSFRIGGLVKKGSVTRSKDGLTVHFTVTDLKHDTDIVYTGILPDLFREGQGVVAQGSMKNDEFVATEVLAKHDENYMPPEVHDALKEAQASTQETP